MKRIIEKLKSLYGISASLGVIIPGYAFFTSYSPPIYKGISLITSALCLAFLVYTLNLKRGKNIVKKGVSNIILSFIVLLIYLFIFSYTTLKIDNENIFQVGFGEIRWSLTPSAIKMIESGNCPRTDNYTLLACAGLDERNIYIVWKKWTVFFAGYLLIILFATSSIFWTVGWCRVANGKVR